MAQQQFRNNIGIPPGYTVDPATGQMTKSATEERSLPNGDFVDQYGDTWRLVGDTWLKGQRDYSGNLVFTNGSLGEVKTREWSAAHPGQDPDAPRQELGGKSMRHALAEQYRPKGPQPGQTVSAAGGAAGGGGMPSEYNALMNDTGYSDAFNGQNALWQMVLGGGVSDADADRRAQVERQTGFDNDAIGRLNDLYGQQQSNATKYNQQDTDLFNTYRSQQEQLNAQDQAGYSRYMSETDPLMSRYNAAGYGAPVQFDPQGLAAQTGAYNWARGAASGSLDYQAAQAYASQAALTQARLNQYSSNPGDIRAQQQALNTLNSVGRGSLDYTADQWRTPTDVLNQQRESIGQIGQDVATGDAQQQAALARIMEDISKGGDGQRAAIDRLRQEIDTGGANQQEALDKYRELSKPEITAQERYLSEIARRSFESQDRGNREAQMQDLALRGMRSGGAEIAGLDSSRQQLGQDRTLAELGLQSNAVQRSMVALEGFANQGNSMRSAQQQALAMYSDAENALRDAQQRGIAMSADQANAIRAAKQQALAMYNDATSRMREQTDAVGTFNTNQSNTARANNQSTRLSGYGMAANQANAIRSSNDQVGMFNTGQANNMSMFNAGQANDMSMFNTGQRNQVSMFNAGQTNQARANNQSTRLAGGIQMGNMANSIRSANDAISMFNKEQSMIQQRFQDQFYQNESTRLAGLAGSRFDANGSTTSSIGSRNTSIFDAGRLTSNTNYGRDTDTINLGIGNAGATHTMRTGTNALQGALGQQHLADLQGVYGSFLGGAGMGFTMSEADKQRKRMAMASGILFGSKPSGSAMR